MQRTEYAPDQESFAALYQCLYAVTQTQGWPALLDAVTGQARSLLHAPYAEIYLCISAERGLELEAGSCEKGLRQPCAGWGCAIAERVLKAQQALIVDKPGLDYASGLIPLMSTVMASPLTTPSGRLGVLVVGAIVPRRFERQECEILTAYTEPVAGILINALHLELARCQVREAQLEAKVSAALMTAQGMAVYQLLLDEIVTTLDLTSGSVWLYDQANDELTRAFTHGTHSLLPSRLKPWDGVAGWVVATGRPYISREFASDPFASPSIRVNAPAGWGGVCAPLQAGGEIVGALYVATQLLREFSVSESALIIRLAEMAGSASKNRSHPLEPARRVFNLDALRTVETTITASLELNITFNVILDQVMRHLGVSAATILLMNQATKELEYGAGRGFPLDPDLHVRISAAEGPVSQVISSRHCIVIPNLAQAPSLCERIKILSQQGFTTYCGVPLIARGQVKGVLEVLNRNQFSPEQEWIDFLELLVTQAAVAIDQATLFTDLRRMNAELAQAYDTTLEGWSRALDLRDSDTEGHTRRVTELTLRLARCFGASEADLIHIRRGALLHDIGKMGTPDCILLKPGPLTDTEWAIMRKHPQYAYEMLFPIQFLRPALDIPYCHHERWDGNGYPRGLKGEEIPLWARIFAVADVWDALLSVRPYKDPFPREKVSEIIFAGAGSQFDPTIVKAFLELDTASNPQLSL